MDKIERIEFFLKLISEISKNDIFIDANLVYSNLIRSTSPIENIREYFEKWIKAFEVNRKIEVFHTPYFKSFCLFVSKDDDVNSYLRIKSYIHLDKTHIYKGVYELFEKISEKDIKHESKVADKIRSDGIVIRTDDRNDINCINDIISKSSYIKEGIQNTSPFTFTDGYLSICWDGLLSYNYVISEWIASYINEMKQKEDNNISFLSFYRYVENEYNKTFIKGAGINEFANSKLWNQDDIPLKLVNYKDITMLLLLSMNINTRLDDFYKFHKKITSKEYIENETIKMRKLYLKDKRKVEVTPEQKETFEYVFYTLSNIRDSKYAIKIFNNFKEKGNYRVFTRKNNIRSMIISAKINKDIMKKLLKYEKEEALIMATRDTFNKYGIEQVKGALMLAKNGNYGGFTRNTRNNLNLLVKPTEIEEIISNILEENDYFDIENDQLNLFLNFIQEREIKKNK